jgi:hypothetical protein
MYVYIKYREKIKILFYQVFTLSNIFGVGHSQSNKNSRKWQFWVGLDKLQKMDFLKLIM